MTTKQKRDLIVRAIEDFVVLYVMFAFCWGICYLVSDILTKMGVG